MSHHAKASRTDARTTAILISATLVASIGVVLAASPSAQAVTFPANARVAYVKGCDIWISHPSGSSVTRITNTPSTCEARPAISRTGRYIAYTHFSSTVATVTVYDLATATRKAIPGSAATPDFSPTNDAVAYHKQTPSTLESDLYSVNVDGTAAKQWTHNPKAGDEEFNGSYFPTWTSDGAALVFSRSNDAPYCRVDRGGYDDIYVAQTLHKVSSSGGESPLVADPTRDVMAGTSAYGKTAYVYRAQPATNSSGYCASNPDDAPMMLVVNGTTVGASDFVSPSVSPQGDVYFSQGGRIKVLPAAGGPPVTLVEGSDPDWGPAYATTVPAKADVVASIVGLKATSKTGNTNRVVARITNRGPNTAQNVELRFGTPKGTFYTKVVRPPRPWTCTMTTLTLIRCKAPALAAGRSAALVVDLLATTKTRTKLAVRAVTSTTDPVMGNNHVVDYQSISYAKRPKAKISTKKPRALRLGSPAARAAGSFTDRKWPKWHSLDDSQQFLVYADKITCSRGGSIGDEGYLSARLWIWEKGKSGSIRLELEGKRQGIAGTPYTGAGLRRTTSLGNFPDNSSSRFTSLVVSWPHGGFGSYKLTGTFKFIRKHLHRNKKFSWPVITTC